MTWEPVIGLEVHAQLSTRSKLFCGCSTEYGAPPNASCCPVCLGMPGALPVPNRGAIELAARAALALGCRVRERSRFARKSYFYPDLAKGYQISQHELPLGSDGALEVKTASGRRRIRIERVHVEEDAAKNLHGRGGRTLVDFDRAGVPLIEIVSHPDLRAADEAEQYLRKLRELLVHIGVNDGNLEEGSFRCDANVSVRRVGDERLGTRAELKNINSFKFVRKAIEHEIARQVGVIETGGQVARETRTWDEGAQRTVAMRGKEEAHDYRYFPDPDLPPLTIDPPWLADIEAALPELPDAMRARWIAELGVTPYDAEVLGADRRLAELFEGTAAGLSARCPTIGGAEAGKRAANFVQAEVTRHLRADAEPPVTAQGLAELLALTVVGTISGKIAKDVLSRMVASGEGPAAIVEAGGLSQVSDERAIEAEVSRVLAAHPDEVAEYRAGKHKLLGFFVGQVMRATGGKANPGVVNRLLVERLS